MKSKTPPLVKFDFLDVTNKLLYYSFWAIPIKTLRAFLFSVSGLRTQNTNTFELCTYPQAALH